MGMLSAVHLEKSHGLQPCLRDVSLEVESGKVTVLIGPSGSGKTTLLRALALVDPPDRGLIRINGQEYSFPGKVAGSGIWPRLTVVFQQFFLWPHLTLRRNITLPLDKRPRCERGYAMLEELILRFDMREIIDHYPNETSLGQRQRAALLRALVLEPDFILLDEITSALDVEMIGILLDYLQTLRACQIGTLLVTHHLGFARRAADRLAFLDGGAILEQGGPAVLERPSNPRVARFLSMMADAA